MEENQGSGISHALAADNLTWTRTISERRRNSWRTVFFGFFRSRRRNVRRTDEAEPMFTDWHHPWLFLMAIGIMVMSSVDAFFTLQLLERGAIETNPLMAAVIGDSALAFATSKMALTAFGILSLVYLSRSMFLDRIRTGFLLTLFFSSYAILICYEFVSLISRM